MAMITLSGTESASCLSDAEVVSVIGCAGAVDGSASDSGSVALALPFPLPLSTLRFAVG